MSSLTCECDTRSMECLSEAKTILPIVKTISLSTNVEGIQVTPTKRRKICLNNF